MEPPANEPVAAGVMATNPANIHAPTQVASAAKIAKTALDTVLPDGLFIGYTVNPAGQPMIGGKIPGFSHGHFLTYGISDGKFGSYSTKPVARTPWGTLSVVGTVRPNGQESGLNLSGLIPSPVGDFLWWINFRNDKLTAEQLGNAIQGTRNGKPLTLSMNFGPMYSASDGTLKALLAHPATAGAAVLPALAAETAGANAWVGVGWRGSVTFKQGRIDSINVSGTSIPWSQVGGFLAQKTAQMRNSPPIGPNFGNRAIASFNVTSQAIFGTSPWDLAHAAVRRDRSGSVVMGRGSVNVLNQGNGLLAVAEPVYELGSRFGLLKVQTSMKNERLVRDVERIRSTSHAARVVDGIFNAVGRRTHTEYFDAVARLMNPYGINHGSMILKHSHESYQSNLGFRYAIDAARQRTGLPPLPAGPAPRPQDIDFVRSIYARSGKPALTLPQPQRGFHL